MDVAQPRKGSLHVFSRLDDDWKGFQQARATNRFIKLLFTHLLSKLII